MWRARTVVAFALFSLTSSLPNPLAAQSKGKGTRLWNLTTGQQRAALQGHTQEVWSVAFSPDGQTLASGSEDGTVRLWDVSTEQQRALLESDQGGILSVAFSPDGKTLAAGGSVWRGGRVTLWDVALVLDRARAAKRAPP